MITTKDIEQELEKEEPTFVGERFIRFMSLEEYYRLIEGQVLVNNARHPRMTGTRWNRYMHGSCRRERSMQ